MGVSDTKKSFNVESEEAGVCCDQPGDEKERLTKVAAASSSVEQGVPTDESTTSEASFIGREGELGEEKLEAAAGDVESDALEM